MEHNPETCPVCQRLGDWTTTPDTAEWFKAHQKAKIHIRLENQKIVED